MDYLRNRFIKNAIRSNVLINRFEILPSRSNDSENRLNAFKSRFNAWTGPFDFYLNRSNDLGNRLNAFDSRLLSIYYRFLFNPLTDIVSVGFPKLGHICPEIIIKFCLLNTLEYPILLWLNMLDCMAFDVWVKLPVAD